MNFRLKRGKRYSTVESALYIEVLNVVYHSESYTKARVALRYKSSGGLVEIKNYKLKHELIRHWTEFEPVEA